MYMNTTTNARVTVIATPPAMEYNEYMAAFYADHTHNDVHLTKSIDLTNVDVLTRKKLLKRRLNSTR